MEKENCAGCALAKIAVRPMSARGSFRLAFSGWSRVPNRWLCGSVICGFWFIGCAKIGDPLPPLVTYPATVDQVDIAQIGNRVEISFPLPAEQVQWVEIFRSCGAPLSADGGLELIARLQRSSLSGGNDGKFVFEGAGVPFQSCDYGLRFANRQGRRSPFSNIVKTLPLAPSRPPQGLRYDVQEDTIIVRWDPPAENTDGTRPPHLVGYLVNSTHHLSAPEYVEVGFQPGQEVSYRVQSVGQLKNPLILSDFSESLTFVPQDLFAPLAPQNVVAVYLDLRVRVVWNANREEDLRGYFVYRGTLPNQLSRLSPLVAINSYQDDSLVAGETYHYSVSAVDEAGNESTKSPTVSISIMSANP